jgi:hypothetical protein
MVVRRPIVALFWCAAALIPLVFSVVGCVSCLFDLDQAVLGIVIAGAAVSALVGYGAMVWRLVVSWREARELRAWQLASQDDLPRVTGDVASAPPQSKPLPSSPLASSLRIAGVLVVVAVGLWLGYRGLKSARCLLPGMCPPATEGECAASANCAQSGMCHLRGEDCVVLSSADCQASTGCTTYGLCKQRGDACVADDEGCRKSTECSLSGSCYPLSTYNCEPASDADCARSRNCKAKGECWKVRGTCGAKTDADCSASDGCRTEGRCYVGDSHFCVTTRPHPVE